MICTLPTCETEASLFLCEEHRFELADLLDNVDFLIVNLDPNIQATKATKKAGGQEGGNGTKSAGSRPPTIDTTQLRAWLWELPRNAYVEARDNPTAGQTLHMARIWVGNARTLVYGAPDIRVITTCECGGKVITSEPKPIPTPQDPDPIDTGTCHTCEKRVNRTNESTRERVTEHVPASLKTRDALKWIRTNSGISVKPTDVRNWAREGKLKRTNPENEKERPAYNVADILTIHYRHANEGKRVAHF